MPLLSPVWPDPNSLFGKRRECSPQASPRGKGEGPARVQSVGVVETGLIMNNGDWRKTYNYFD